MPQQSRFGIPGLPGTPDFRPSFFPRTRAPSREPKTTITPEEEEGLAKKVVRGTVGGLAAVGNLLGVPGSMVKDVLVGENPFDQLLTPLSDVNRTSGRQLLRHYGMAGKKDTWGNFFGGLAADIATDPLTYIMPLGAATKAGSVVKSAGISDDTIRAMGMAKTGKSVGQLGRREALVSTKFGDVMSAVAGTPKETAINTVLTKRGLRAADIADEPLRGGLGLGFMGKTMGTVGTGAKGQKYARKVDELGRTLRYGKVPGTEFSPGEQLSKLWGHKLGGTSGEAGQFYAGKGWEAREAARVAANTKIAASVRVLEKHGWHTEQQSPVLRRIFENPISSAHPDYAAAPQAVKEVLDSLEEFKNGIRDLVVAEGGTMDEYKTALAQHWPRYGAKEDLNLPSGAGTSKPLSGFNQSAQGRIPILRSFVEEVNGVKVERAIQGETETIKQVISDPEIGKLIEGGGKLEDISQLIKQKYGHVVPEKYLNEAGEAKNRYAAWADWISSMDPEHRKAGFFANNPVSDLHTYAVGGLGQVASLRAIREYLVSPQTILDPSSVALEQRGFKTLDEALSGITGKIDKRAFSQKLFADQLQGMPPAAKRAYLDKVGAMAGKAWNEVSIDDMTAYTLKSRVTEETADNIGRILTGFTSPQPVGEIMKHIDSFTNLFKGMNTGIWPAFHVRNLASGQFQNWLNGVWSVDSTLDTWKLIRGNTVEGASRIPAVQAAALERGIAAGALTDKLATDILGELAYAHNMTGKYAGEAMARVGMEGAFKPQKIEDLLQEIPRTGVNSANFKEVGAKAIGAAEGTSYNPFAMRGVGGRTESTFAPAAAGDHAAHISESLNRIAPFINQLKKGVDPAEAANRVGKLQVMYDARYFTPLERDVLQRAFPFYKFSSRMGVWALQELAHRPGGPLAQAIRATTSLRNPTAMTPEYVQDTASIPFGKGADGSQSYISGFGMMHEDPAQFLSGGGPGKVLRNMGLEALSRTNPLIKSPLEWGTGQSFFQKGPGGGRRLEDLDPTIGRTLANISGRDKAVRWPGSEGAEFLAGNFIGRPLTTARSTSGLLKDPTPGNLGKTALNMLSGVRVTTVRPEAQEAMLRENLAQLMKGSGAKDFVKSYIPEEVEQQLSPQELEDARKMEALMHLLSMRAKARREKKEAAK